MDGDRFDSLTRSLAAPASRRRALRLFGAGGLLGAAGRALPAAAASPAACQLTIAGLLSSGPSAGGSVDGALSLTIQPDGTIDQASFVTDGQTMAAVGRAVGRTLELLIDLGDGTTLVLTGVGQMNIAACQGVIAGLVGGPKPGDVGSWSAAPVATTGGGSGTAGNASGGANSGNATGGGTAGGETGGNGCASGVVCGGTCCTPAAGTTPDAIACNGNSCSCTYSCQAAGCPNGGTDHSFRVGCGDRPDAHCGEQCTVPAGSGCPGVTCPAEQSLDLGTCTCVGAGGPNGGAGAACPGTTNCGTAANPICADTLTDANHCGGCEVKCAAGQECVSSACSNPCPAGHARCGAGQCVDLQSDVLNCGACGTLCAADLFCASGVCTCPAGRTLCNTAAGGQACVDLQGDPNNCGACGTPCLSFEDCNAGFCSSKCGAAGLATCSDGCADLTTDNNNCGACGMVCPAGTNCHNQVCS